MKVEGGCHCGKVRYQAVGEPMLSAQCHCRPCQYFSGGAANMFMLMPPEGFEYTRGAPRGFAHDDPERAVTWEFCGECGTHLSTRRHGLRATILKAGTFDDPSLFGMAQMAINVRDKQVFNWIEAGLPTFEKVPPHHC